MNREKGFTLIELMIVVVVIGIIAAIAVPNFISLKAKSEHGSCVSNQRNIVQGATLYAIEQGVTDAIINVTALQPDGYINNVTSECPASVVLDEDDYTVTIEGSAITAISCDVFTSEHTFTP